jgi:multidrug efflux pump subunit AcrA (membrane-fusion protein)
VIYQL